MTGRYRVALGEVPLDLSAIAQGCGGELRDRVGLQAQQLLLGFGAGDAPKCSESTMMIFNSTII